MNLLEFEDIDAEVRDILGAVASLLRKENLIRTASKVSAEVWDDKHVIYDVGRSTDDLTQDQHYLYELSAACLKYLEGISTEEQALRFEIERLHEHVFRVPEINRLQQSSRAKKPRGNEQKVLAENIFKAFCLKHNRAPRAKELCRLLDNEKGAGAAVPNTVKNWLTEFKRN